MWLSGRDLTLPRFRKTKDAFPSVFSRLDVDPALLAQQGQSAGKRCAVHGKAGTQRHLISLERDREGDAKEKGLSVGFGMDSTTLTRTLALLRKQGWIHVKPGKDRRERVFRLTEAGKRQIAATQPHWEAAERHLRETLGSSGWKQMQTTVAQATNATTEG